jgi:hypothetical protein
MFEIDLDEKDLKEITLNGKALKHIANNDLKQMIINHLFQTYYIKMNCTNKFFTAIDPNRDMEILKKYKHMAYVNTNQRICLLALVTFKQRPICLFIDKQNALFYVLKCQFSPSLYNGTIFEGEMVDSYFLVSDFLVYMGKSISSHALDRRLTLLYSILSSKNYRYDPLLDPFQVVIKDFVEFAELSSYIHDYIPTLPYKNKINGFIFRPNENSNRNLIYNFNSKSFSIKPHNDTVSVATVADTTTDRKINIDKHAEVKFLLFETGNPDDYCLKLLDQNGQLFAYDYALVNDMKTSQFLQQTLDHTSGLIKKMGLCVLCQYKPTFQKWKPIKILDEQYPDEIMKLL